MKIQAIINPERFTAMRKKDSGETHLFRVNFAAGTWTSQSTSVCRKMSASERDTVPFTSLDEDEARGRCAAIGKMVCGTCVSTLYTTPS